jgi:hypothetical protein
MNNNFDIYKRNLRKDEEIYLLLLKFISEPNICKYIIKEKNILEKKEILEYHYERWKNISCLHYEIHKNHMDKFSYVLDSKKYIIKPDYDLSFYKKTGISYQILELIHELIKIKSEFFQWFKEINNFKDYREWLEHDDNLYTILADKITQKMEE